jgi:hypothetical protein
MGECQPDEWAAQQTILLKLNMCNIDKIARDLNSSPIWTDANLVARLVISVAGSRDNWMDLIELMRMLHQSWGDILRSLMRFLRSKK